MWIMSIQYLVSGSKFTTSWLWVPCLKKSTWSPVQYCLNVYLYFVADLGPFILPTIRSKEDLLCEAVERFPIFKKWANSGLFFVYFRSFSNKHHYNFTTNICEKCPSSIRCRDSNPRPSECESLPFTTRPGLQFLAMQPSMAGHIKSSIL